MPQFIATGRSSETVSLEGPKQALATDRRRDRVKRVSQAVIEPLEDRRLFSVVTITPIARTTNTINDGISTLPRPVTPAPTLTITGVASSDKTVPVPVVTVLGASGSGPHTVFVHALGSILNGGTPLTARYVWDFGNPGSEYNTLVGWNAAHTYEAPGTYPITLTLTNELGKTTVFTVSVTVTPAVRRTIYVDSVLGNDNNTGSTIQAPIKTIDKVIKLLGSNTQVLFRAGETFPVDQGISLPYTNVLFGSYGVGSPPVLKRVPGLGSSILSMFNNSVNLVVQDLAFDSIYKPTGVIVNKVPAEGIFIAGQDITVRRCTFLNLDVAIDGDRNPQGTLVQDCIAPLTTGLRGVFIWGQGTDQVYLGNFVENSTREHDIRTVWVTRELIAFNNLTNLDRSKLGDILDYSKGTVDVHRGSYAYVADNYLYGGELRIGPRSGPTAVPGDTSQWCVFEGNHVFGHAVQVYPGTYHVLMRNNIISIEHTTAISIVPHNPAGDNITDITIVNNTGISLSDAGQFLNITSLGTPGSVTVANNLWVAPNVIPGMNGTAAIYIADNTSAVLKTSANNVWPSPTTFNRYAAGGINYIWPTWLPPHGYYTPAAWAALPFVRSDHFSQTPVTSGDAPLVGTLAATTAAPFPGVFVDINGKARPANGLWSAGAVQT